MKMVILIVKDHDADEITQALTSEKYRVTRVASTGGADGTGKAQARIAIDRVRKAIRDRKVLLIVTS